MKKTLTLIVVATAAIASASHVPAEWKARYAATLKLMTSKNVSGFKAMFSDDFVDVSPEGKTMSRDEWFKQVDDIFKADGLGATIDVNNVVVRGNAVDVSYVFDVSLHMKKHLTKVHEVGIDTWKKIGGKWLMVKTVDKVLTFKNVR